MTDENDRHFPTGPSYRVSSADVLKLSGDVVGGVWALAPLHAVVCVD